MPELEHITVNAAATRLRKSETTIKRWLRDGRLNGRKEKGGNPGGVWVVDRESVERMAAGVDAQDQATSEATIGAAVLQELWELRREVGDLRAEVRRLLPPAPTARRKRRWQFWKH